MATTTTDLPTDLPTPLEDRPRTSCCTYWCCTRSASAAGVVLAISVIATILQFFTGGVLYYILAILFGAILPAIVVMVWFSEAQGGYSVDKCQIATVSFTCMGLMVAWLLVQPFFGAALTAFTALDPTCCFPLPLIISNASNATINSTAAPSPVAPLPPRPFCFCPGAGLTMGIGGALPEEVLKYAAFSMFA